VHTTLFFGEPAWESIGSGKMANIRIAKRRCLKRKYRNNEELTAVRKFCKIREKMNPEVGP